MYYTLSEKQQEVFWIVQENSGSVKFNWETKKCFSGKVEIPLKTVQALAFIGLIYLDW